MRQAKEYEVLNCKLDKLISDKLTKYCEDTRLSKTATVERALDEYLKKYYNERKQTGKV